MADAKNKIEKAEKYDLIWQDNKDLKKDKEHYRLAADNYRDAYEIKAAEVATAQRQTAVADRKTESCLVENGELKEENVKERKRTKRAKNGTKWTAGLGLILATGVLILSK